MQLEQRPRPALPQLRDGQRRQPRHAASALKLVGFRLVAQDSITQLGESRLRDESKRIREAPTVGPSVRSLWLILLWTAFGAKVGRWAMHVLE